MQLLAQECFNPAVISTLAKLKEKVINLKIPFPSLNQKNNMQSESRKLKKNIFVMSPPPHKKKQCQAQRLQVNIQKNTEGLRSSALTKDLLCKGLILFDLNTWSANFLLLQPSLVIFCGKKRQRQDFATYGRCNVKKWFFCK